MKIIFNLLLLIFYFHSFYCSIYEYDELEILDAHYVSYTVGVYTVEDSPYGSETPTIDFNIKFREEGDIEENFDVLLFHSEKEDNFGVELDGIRYFCCTANLYKLGYCNELGKAVWKESNNTNDIAYSWSYSFKSNSTYPQTLEEKKELTVTGIWRLYLINCHIEDTEVPVRKDKDGFYEGSIILNGKIDWVNPYGHLPGQIFPFLPLYMVLAILFFFLGVVWLALCIKYRQDILGLQSALAVVIFFAFLENLIFGFDFYNYNITGRISLAFNVIGVLLTIFKITCSWILLYLIATGYTVIKPELEKKEKSTILILFGSFFVLYSIYQILNMLRYTPQTRYLEISSGIVSLFSFVVTLAETGLMILIFFSLFGVLHLLKEKKETFKMNKYRRLLMCIIGSLPFSVILFFVEVIGIVGGSFTQWWEGWWFFDGYWDILYLILIALIGFLWKPSANNSAYGYSTQIDTSGNVELDSHNAPE